MDDNVAQLVPIPDVPTVHKFAIFIIGGIAAFGAQMLVERGYLKGLDLYRAAQTPELTK